MAGQVGPDGEIPGQAGDDVESPIKTKPDSLTNQGLPGIRCKGIEKIMISNRYRCC